MSHTRQTIMYFTCTLLIGVAVAGAADPAAWAPAAAPIMTRWAKDVSPANALPEYPRPQMVREKWTNLNGLWQYAIVDGNDDCPSQWQGQILVPYPIESALSGVGKSIGPAQALWYQRTFDRPTGGERMLLHFGAVDWQATVYVNGQYVGDHTGGFDPFTFDITSALRDGANTLTVRVWDPTDAGAQPRGKQVLRPGGIWYTPVTGIWQTVWLEPVPATYIRELHIVPDVPAESVHVTVDASGAEGRIVSIEVIEKGQTIATGSGKVGEAVTAKIPNPKLWSPDDPHLYSLIVHLHDSEGVESYFGLRSIEMKKDDAGVNRMFLNGKPLFQYGPLDQGWWPDGLYTAPTDDALRYDIEITRKMGFNMARKHVKVEPSRWYYWADRLGLLVWQDMPSGFVNMPGRRMNVAGGSKEEGLFTATEARQYMDEWKAIMQALHNHPSIVVWVPFNEGWGQHDTNDILRWTMAHDPTRLVNGPSGWEDRGVGHMHDMHNYPGPGMFPLSADRISVLGEFGGLGLPLEGHLWQTDKNWGYRKLTGRQELADGYQQLMFNLKPLIDRGLAAAVYTQTTDVEIEVNGLMTYDRAVNKIDPDKLAAMHARLYAPAGKVVTLVPTAEQAKSQWQYTTDQPADAWFKPGFDAGSWKTATGGFGTEGTPSTVIGSQWKTADIWLRRTFSLDAPPTDPIALNIHHDEDAVVYINGVEVARLTGYTTSYMLIPLPEKARAALRAGENTLAVHCHQQTGGQYIDAGLSTLVPAAP